MHGAALMKAMNKRRSDLRFIGIGGDRMIAQGLKPIRHSSEIAFLGFFEVIRHLKFINRVFQETLSALKNQQPDLVILIDYPGFNLRFAEKSRKLGFRNLYYISPQVWAWKKGRVNQMARCIDRMLVILPFETDLYREKGMDVHFVGHPLKGALIPEKSRQEFLRDTRLQPERPVIGLLPGSRKQEISKLLPEMSKACDTIRRQIPDIQFVLGMAPHLTIEDYQPYLKNRTDIQMVREATYSVMAHTDAVLVASGTATLETALLGTPMVICYKLSPFSYYLGRLLVKIRFIGLVNIIADKKIVPELIQNDANAKKMAEAVTLFITDKKVRAQTKENLKAVSDRLGEPGASERAAKLAIEMIDKGPA